MRLPESPPDLAAQVRALGPKRLEAILARPQPPDVDGEWAHWDELRRRAPPGGLTVEEWWIGISWSRRALRAQLPLVDKQGNPFGLCQPSATQQALHRLDRLIGLPLGEAGPLRQNPELRDAWLVSTLVEEAITSSQLEGAATTRKVAQELLRTGRKPLTRDERMIANNYAAMQLIRSERGRRPLSLEFLLELQRILTEGAIDEPDAAGRLRRGDEAVYVQDLGDGTTLFVPPDAAQLPARLEALIAFANDADAEPFLHPVLRAITLHFALAYEHPFVDGNGRTARALFYWSLLRGGYWLAEYLSISAEIRKAPAQYGRAFLFAETDSSDLTYFVFHQLKVIRDAVESLRKRLDRKVEQMRALERQLRDGSELNARQRALLSHALRHPGHRYTIEAHRRSHGVVYQTARTDLLGLAKSGLLTQRKVARAMVFEAPKDLGRRLKK